jgi:transcriptional regulator with XRE-family HTH domain
MSDHQAGESSKAAFANMRRLRQRNGLSCEQLVAELAAVGFAVGRSVLANQENGRVAMMPLDQAAALCRVFGVTFEDLIDPKPCGRCGNQPPVGFTCNECGRAAK